MIVVQHVMMMHMNMALSRVMSQSTASGILYAANAGNGYERKENSMKDKHHGETCIIIGNGPSLRDVDVNFLYKYPTFGSNRIYLLPFTPTYYAAVNPLVLEQFHDEIDGLTCVKFIKSKYYNIIDGAIPLVSTTQLLFATNPMRCIYEGFTVTYVLLQLAYWMGFHRVGLVGVDHKYTFNGSPNGQKLLVGDDPNHFDARYFSGHQWNNPDLKRSEQAYKLAREAYEADCREIINLTPGTALDVFKKGDITKW